MDKTDDIIDLKKYTRPLRKKWYWYLIAFIIFTSMAITYCFVRMPQYQSHCTILIEDEESQSSSKSMGVGGMSQLMRSFSVGGFGANSIDNEMLIFETHNLLCQMIDRLGLNRTYIEKNGLEKVLLYKTSPVLIDAPKSLFDTLQISTKVKIHLHDGKADVKMQKGYLSTTIAESKNQTLPFTFKTPIGNFQILKSASYNPKEDRKITVNMSGTDIIADYYSKMITIDYTSKKADGITLDIKAPTKQLGQDILNTMTTIYDEIRLTRKNQKAKISLDFYDQQIAELSNSLTEAEKNVENFKSANKMVDISTEAQIALSNDDAYQKKKMAFSSQIIIYDMILKVINDPNKRFSLLPSIEDKGASEIVNQYNELILQKMEIEHSARTDNVSHKLLIEKISALRDIVKENINQLKNNVLVNLKSINTENAKSKSLLNKVPAFERQYYDLMRNKELKNDLYVFLLEKRYNAALNLATNNSQGFVIDKAFSDVKPDYTKSLIALAVALALTLLLPTILILSLNHKKKDKN